MFPDTISIADAIIALLAPEASQDIKDKINAASDRLKQFDTLTKTMEIAQTQAATARDSALAQITALNKQITDLTSDNSTKATIINQLNLQILALTPVTGSEITKQEFGRRIAPMIFSFSTRSPEKQVKWDRIIKFLDNYTVINLNDPVVIGAVQGAVVDEMMTQEQGTAVLFIG